MPMNRFIIVLHKHFAGTSEGFECHEVEAESKQAAREKGYALRGKRDRTFSNCHFTVVEVGPNERLKDHSSRRLTLGERITGKISPERYEHTR